VLALVHLLASSGYRDISRIYNEETLSWLAFKHYWRTSMMQLHGELICKELDSLLGQLFEQDVVAHELLLYRFANNRLLIHFLQASRHFFIFHSSIFNSDALLRTFITLCQ